MSTLWTHSAKVLAALGLLAAGTSLIGHTKAATGTSGPARAGFTSRAFASGTKLTHETPKGKEMISQPDDITSLGADIFVGFQNGVGPQGQPSTTGNRDSTIVEFDRNGRAVGQWDVVGKCDGVTADPATGKLVATVNEDANSSLYVIDPAPGATPVHYRYDRPLPSKGGTDAISFYRGMTLISASAPGTTGVAAPQPTYPAVYRVDLNARTDVASIHPLFFDEASAVVANTNSDMYGKDVKLALTDPDSNEDVPAFAPRFAGDFMLTSQGDKEQIFVHGAGHGNQSLTVLKLSDSVDDTAWASDSSGAIYTTDNSNDTIYEVTGPFRRGEVFVADTPCDADNAPPTCPAPGFPANFLGRLNSDTGHITKVHIIGPAPAAQGMYFAH